MFILRCSFWLVIGFLVIKPFAFEPESASKALANAAISGASELIVQNANQLDCPDLRCNTIKQVVVATAMASKPVITPVQTSGLAASPVPPPRPDWAG